MVFEGNIEIDTNCLKETLKMGVGVPLGGIDSPKRGRGYQKVAFLSQKWVFLVIFEGKMRGKEQ